MDCKVSGPAGFCFLAPNTCLNVTAKQEIPNKWLTKTQVHDITLKKKYKKKKNHPWVQTQSGFPSQQIWATLAGHIFREVKQRR